MIKMLSYPKNNGAEIVKACDGREMTLISIEDHTGVFHLENGDVHALRLGDHKILTGVDVFPELGLVTFAGSHDTQMILNKAGELTKPQQKWLESFKSSLSYIPDGINVHFTKVDGEVKLQLVMDADLTESEKPIVEWAVPEETVQKFKFSNTK